MGPIPTIREATLNLTGFIFNFNNVLHPDLFIVLKTYKGLLIGLAVKMMIKI
jgi:hypothetical protein